MPTGLCSDTWLSFGNVRSYLYQVIHVIISFRSSTSSVSEASVTIQPGSPKATAWRTAVLIYSILGKRRVRMDYPSKVTARCVISFFSCFNNADRFGNTTLTRVRQLTELGMHFKVLRYLSSSLCRWYGQGWSSGGFQNQEECEAGVCNLGTTMFINNPVRYSQF